MIVRHEVIEDREGDRAADFVKEDDSDEEVEGIVIAFFTHLERDSSI